jgi:hypothetical protein
VEKANEKIDATLVLESAVQTLGGSISENNARVECASSLPSLRMHFAHLQQLFQNLEVDPIFWTKKDPFLR